MKFAGVWISRASTYTWPLQPAKWVSRPSSSSTPPLPNHSTCTPTCPCASGGGATPVTTGRQTQTPTCRRGLGGLGKWLERVSSVMTSERRQTQCCPRDSGEIYHTGAFLGLWPVNSYWTVTCTGRHILHDVVDLQRTPYKHLYCSFAHVYVITVMSKAP